MFQEFAPVGEAWVSSQAGRGDEEKKKARGIMGVREVYGGGLHDYT